MQKSILPRTFRINLITRCFKQKEETKHVTVFTFVLVVIPGYEFRMLQHLYEMVFLLNSSMAMDLVTIACFLVSIVTLLLAASVV